MTEKVKKKRYFPSSFLIIIGLMLIFIVASWIGQPLTSDSDTPIVGVGLLDIFTSIWRGFISKGAVILFIFAIGGTLAILSKVKIIDSGIEALVKKLGDKVLILIPVLMIILGLGGTTYGMCEETIAFIPILIPVFKKAGYGSFTAIMVILLGAGTGCLASTINPFSIGTAVSAANSVDGVDITTGTAQATRWISFLLFEMVAIAFVLWIATRYKKALVNKVTTDKQAKLDAKNKSGRFISFFTRARVVEGVDEKYIEQKFAKIETKDLKFTLKKKISLSLFIFAFVLMIVMYLPWTDWISVYTIQDIQEGWDNSMFWFASTTTMGDGGTGFTKFGNWYMISIGALFFVVAVTILFINFSEFKTENENQEQTFISCFLDGIKDVLGCCMLISTAAALGLILDTTGYGPLIAQSCSEGLDSWILFGVVIFLVSIVLSFFIPSTSGFSAAFIPIFAETAYLAFGEKEPEMVATAVSIAILAFVFASGIVNLISPTAAALVAYTSYAGFSYVIWVKQMWRVVLAYFVLSLLIIIMISWIASTGTALV